MSFLYQKFTNVRFKYNEWRSASPKLSPEQRVLNVLGTIFEVEKDGDFAKANRSLAWFLSQIPWFTYSKGIDQIVRSRDGAVLANDVGWGCVVRSGQMLLFIVILRLQFPEHLGKVERAEEPGLELIRKYFRERSANEALEKSKLGTFALQNFVREANKICRLEEGSWFRSTTFVIALSELLKIEPIQDLHLLNVFEHCFYLGDLCDQAFRKPLKLVPRRTKEAVSLLSNQEWDHPVLVNLCMMLGVESTVDPKYDRLLLKMTKLGSFVGMIGGYAQRAFFFVGCNERGEFLYLDPHYVREAQADLSSDERVRNHYFQKSFMWIGIRQMSSSLMLSHLIRSREEFCSYYSALTELRQLYGEHYPIGHMLRATSMDSDCEN